MDRRVRRSDILSIFPFFPKKQDGRWPRKADFSCETFSVERVEIYWKRGGNGHSVKSACRDRPPLTSVQTIA
ncbi:MAG TPA: hypothetical protein DEB39_01445 [Planctomycetaceae bacterium]|nr:hypothetical protein [Planctomycetaceae bacterium]